MFKIFIIGLSAPHLSDEQVDLLRQCSLIVGTKRFEKLCGGFDASYLPITPLAKATSAIHKNLEGGNVAVLASGDPLYFGIGKKILSEFTKDQVLFFPALSSLQSACALFKTPWDDATVISLHGRTNHHIPGLVLLNTKSLLLTDKNNTPTGIAANIVHYLKLIGEPELIKATKIHVAEDIGLETEKLSYGDATSISKQQFSPLNIMLVELPQRKNTTPFTFGLTEDEICHSRGLITKNEVRAATLHQLRLQHNGVFWDVGAGSGSMSIEAARSVPGLTVYSVEHKEEELLNIKKNIKKFCCYNMVPVFGRAPESLYDLPDPDCIFIGGSSGSLPDIIALAADRLRLGGRLVVNGVIAKTITQAPILMAQNGFTVTKSVINVSRSGHDGTTDDFNPITIVTGTK